MKKTGVIVISCIAAVVLCLVVMAIRKIQNGSGIDSPKAENAQMEVVKEEAAGGQAISVSAGDEKKLSDEKSDFSTEKAAGKSGADSTTVPAGKESSESGTSLEWPEASVEETVAASTENELLYFPGDSGETEMELPTETFATVDWDNPQYEPETGTSATKESVTEQEPASPSESESSTERESTSPSESESSTEQESTSPSESESSTEPESSESESTSESETETETETEIPTLSPQELESIAKEIVAPIDLPPIRF